MNDNFAVNRQQLFAAFFFAAFIFLLFQLYALFATFLVPLVWTVILVLTFYPLYSLVLGVCRGRRTLAALGMTLFVVLMVAIPVVFFSGVLAREVADFYRQVRHAVVSGELQQLLAGWRDTALGQLWQKWGPQAAAFDIDLPGLALTGANAVSQYILEQLRNVAQNVFRFIFGFVVMSFSLFFLFRDGEGWYHTIRDLLPMEPSHKEAIFIRLYDTVSAVVQGMVATAVTQGALAGIGFWAVGLSFSFSLACLSAFFAMLPIGGAAAVWLPCAGYLAISGLWGQAIGLLLYGTFVISMVDNFLKPVIIGGRAKLPTVFLFFGILGGLQAYGFLGMFLGPVVLGTILAFVEIYRQEYAQQPARP